MLAGGFELVVGILEGFFGCGCILLMCIGFCVGVGIWGHSGVGLYFKVFGGMVRIGCISLRVSRILRA